MNLLDTKIVRVATINILNDLRRWPERRVLLARGLAEFSPISSASKK